MSERNDGRLLGATLTGQVHAPGSDGWDLARAAWQLRADQRPAFVVTASSAADVEAAVNAARDNGMRVALQNTGHGASALGDLDDVVLVRTGALQDLEVDPEKRLLRVGAGVLWADAVRASASHGLAGLAGSAGDVGVVGYTLGGGLSWLGRRYGFAANDVVRFEVVTADGELLEVDATHEPELFWALRGGGGGFAAVVAAEMRLHRLHQLKAGLLAWPQGRAAEVGERYLEWAGHLTDATASCLRLMNVPDAPDTPPLVRGRSVVLVEVVHQGIDIDEILAPLRALKPDLDTIGDATTESLLHLHMDPPTPVPVVGDGAVVSTADHGTLDAVLEVAGPGTDSPLLSLELRQLGGALRTASPGAGCLSHIDGEFAMFAVGVAPDEPTAGALRSRIDSLHDALSPWRATHDLINYREVPVEPERFFSQPTLRRLRAVKATYDPDRVFVANHRVVA